MLKPLKLKKFALSFFFCVFSTHALIAAPVISNISPDKGSALGGDIITITGTGLSNASTVQFGSLPATILQNSDSTLIVQAPNSSPLTPTPNEPITTIGSVAVEVTVTNPSGTSSYSRNALYTFIGHWVAYISDHTGEIIAVDLASNKVGFITTLDPTATWGTSAITPNGKFAYCPIGSTTNPTVAVLNLTNYATTFFSLSNSSVSKAVAIAPNGKTAYIASPDTNKVHAITLPTNTEIVNARFPLTIPSPNDLIVSPDGTFLYVMSNDSSGKIVKVDLTDTTIAPTSINLTTNPLRSLAITPDGKTIYSVASGISNIVYAINSSFLDLPTSMPIGNGGQFSRMLAIAPNGSYALVVNSSDATISKIALGTGTTTTIGPLTGYSLYSIAITPDSQKAYVAGQNSGQSVLVPIDMTTDSFLSTQAVNLATLGTPYYITIAPDQAPVARFVVTPDYAGSASSFDASSSIAPVGNITKYVWDFGDGTPPLSTNTPITTHTYATVGQYTVTLTVTNSGTTSLQQTFTGQTVSNQGTPLDTNDLLAQLKLAVNITPAPVDNPKFCGTLIKYHNATYELATSWKAISSPRVSYYEVYANNKRIAKISKNGPLQFKKSLNISDFYKDHSGKYIRFLGNKYKLCAVSIDGVRSPFACLDIEKVITISNKKKLHKCQSQVPGILQNIIPTTR